MSIPYMPLFVGDYKADTTHLSLEEHGVYLALLMLCWQTPGCSIPDDRAWIARRLRVSDADYDRVVTPVLDEFFKRAKARLFSARLSEEFERVSATCKKRSEAGKKGGRPSKSLENNNFDESRDKAGPKQPEPEPEPEPNIFNPLIPPGEGETVTKLDEHRPEKPKKKRQQFPPDWKPTEAGERYAFERGCVHLDTAVRACIDHHRSKGNTFLDFDAAWRTWCNKGSEYKSPGFRAGVETGERKLTAEEMRVNAEKRRALLGKWG